MGTDVATDDVAGVHYQVVKLANGTADSTAVVAVDVGAKANALRVAPANDITDTTYIGDIKFGEALPAGTNAIGKLAANTGVDIGDVDVTSVVPGTAATNLGKAEDAAHTSGDVGVMALTVRQDTAAALGQTDADYQPLITDASGRLHVLDASTTAGDVAHDGADSGNPVKCGGKAYTIDGTVPGAAVAEADRTHFITDLYGRQFVETSSPYFWTASADYSEAQTNASIKATPGASLRLRITDILISNGATAGNITLLDGSGGTVLWEIYPAINGGCVSNLRTPIVLTANTALCITSTTVTTHSVTISGDIIPG